MRFAFALCLALLALPAYAGGSKGDYVSTRGGGSTTDPGRETGTGPRQDPVERFVESNITETLYHELGHALIDTMELPVFGPEEFATDFFAIVMMNRLHSEEEIVAMTYDVAAAYDAGATKESTAGSGPAMWDIHGSDRQRYFNLVCHMYGANPEERDDVAEELGLPEARADTCEDEYEMSSRSWGMVFDQLVEGAPGTSLDMDWVLDSESHLTKFVSAEVDRLNAALVLPEPITVSVIPCDEVNAFYDPGPREIIICIEMGDHLADLAR